MKKFDVIGFGALNIDKTRIVNEEVEEGERILSDYFENEDFELRVSPGGSAANTVVGLSRLGLKTAYIGKVGNDEEGLFLLNDLREEGVDISGVRKENGRSGIAYIVVGKKGKRAIQTEPGVNDTIRMEDIDFDYLKETKILHLTSFMSKYTDESFLTQKKIVEKFPDIKISFDPGECYAKRGMKEMESIIKRTHIILPNERELKLLTGCDHINGCKALLDTGVDIVAVKRGERGCYVTNGSMECYVPSESVHVVDTTGAGDAFNAGFLYGIIRSKPLEYCGKLGNFVASQCIMKYGARDGLPFFLNNHKKIF